MPTNVRGCTISPCQYSDYWVTRWPDGMITVAPSHDRALAIVESVMDAHDRTRRALLREPTENGTSAP